MSSLKRIVWLIIIVVLAIAGILAFMPIGFLWKLLAWSILSVFTALALAVTLTGDTDLFRKMFAWSPPSVSTRELLKHLAQKRLLARSESLGHEPIYRLDTDYWTNLELDFDKLVLRSDTLDLCAGCVGHYLSRGLRWVLFVDPLEVKKKQSAIRQTLLEIVKRVPSKGRAVWSQEIHTVSKAIVLAGVFSPNISDFLLEEAERIAAAIFLIGPDLAYLSKKFKDLPFKATSIISIDTIDELDTEVRKSILW